MNLGVALLAFALCIVMSAVYSGSETAFYSLSRTRLDADVHQKRRSALLIQRLLLDERSLLITILIGNNLMLELVTTQADDLMGRLGDVPGAWREVLLTLVLTPILFLLGELIPKDIFRGRPHTLLGITAPVIALSKGLFAPLRIPLSGVSRLLERVLRLSAGEVGKTLGRERMLELLKEGAESGAIPPHARELADNVLSLRSIPVQRVMVPWAQVHCLDLGATTAALRRAVSASEHTRLPVIEGGSGVVGYVHQLEVLAASEHGDLRPHLRALPCLAPDLPVDRALSRMRITGQRAALVGSPSRPLGLVTLKDLVQTISGDLVDW